MKYLTNAFSLNMFKPNLDPRLTIRLTVRHISPDDVPTDAVSTIGHVDTAAVVSGVLGRTVEANRQTVILDEGDEMFVAQYSGPRLPEGAMVLPEGAQIEFLRVRIVNIDDMSA